MSKEALRGIRIRRPGDRNTEPSAAQRRKAELMQEGQDFSFDLVSSPIKGMRDGLPAAAFNHDAIALDGCVELAPEVDESAKIRDAAVVRLN